MVYMKQLNYIGAALGTSVLLVPLTGISAEAFHFIYGMLYLGYSLSYAGYVMTNELPVPGLRRVEAVAGRGAINALMLLMVFLVVIYAAYGVQGWVMATTGNG